MPEISRRVALTGASGFVGRHVLARLVDQGWDVRVLAREPGRLALADPRVEVVRGDLFDGGALRELVKGVGSVIHLVGIIMEKPGAGQTFERVHVEGTTRVLAAAKEAGVRRWVQMSALGTRPDAVSRYHQTKWLAEQAVRESGMAWTIFRPSVIHGPDGEFMEMVKGFWCNRFPPFVPYFSRRAGLRDILEIKKSVMRFMMGAKIMGEAYVSGAAAGRVQPVWVEDVAACFAGALGNEKSVEEVYPLGGPDEFTWPGMYLACRKALPKARNKIVAPLPVWYAEMIAGLPGVPFNRDQVVMSQENSTCRIEKVEGDFGMRLAGFEKTVMEYAGEIE